MADFPLSTGRGTNLPIIPLLGTDLIEISQFRSGVWSTAVITISELLNFIGNEVVLNANRIQAGTLPIDRGGTNGTTKAEARSSLEVPGLSGNNAFVGDQSVTGKVSATDGFDDT